MPQDAKPGRPGRPERIDPKQSSEETRSDARGGALLTVIGVLALAGVALLLYLPTAKSGPAGVSGSGDGGVASHAEDPPESAAADDAGAADPPAPPEPPAGRTQATAPATVPVASRTESPGDPPAPAVGTAGVDTTSPAPAAVAEHEEVRPDLSAEQMRQLHDALSAYRAVLGVSEDDETDETEVQP